MELHLNILDCLSVHDAVIFTEQCPFLNTNIENIEKLNLKHKYISLKQ